MAGLTHSLRRVLPIEPGRRRRGRYAPSELIVVGLAGAGVGAFVLASSSLPSSTRFLALVAVLAPLVAVLVGHLRYLLLAAILLDLPFQWDTNLSYQTDAAKLGALGGINISVTTIALAALYGMWLWEAALSPARRVPRLQLGAAAPVLLFVGLTTLSVFVARDARLAWYEVALLVQMLLLFLYVASAVRTRTDLHVIVVFLLVGLVLESILILLAFHTGESFNFAGLSTHNSTFAAEGFRPAGTLGSPNSAGAYLSMMLLPAAAVLLSPFAKPTRLLAVLALVLGAYALIVTQSRGGWLAFLVGAAVFGAAARHRRWLSGRVVAGIAATALVVALLGAGVVANRLSGDDNGAAESRVPLMRLAADVIRDQPLVGVGANNFPLVISEYAGPEFSGQFLYTVHNKYLLIWAEAGLGALLAFIWFLANALRRGWRCVVAGDGLVPPLALGFTAALAGHVVAMMVDVFRGRADVQPLMLLTGLLVACGAMLSASREATALDPAPAADRLPARPEREAPWPA